MDKELESLRWFWEWDPSRSAGVGFATENVWSRQARRKMKLAGQHGSSTKIDTVPDGVAVGIRVEAKLVQGQSDSSNKNEVQIVIHWIQGMDSVLFESFCGMLKRKLESSKPQESEK
jgi:23S rRNA (adenine1618-N6)-methyltransferase